MPFSTLLVRAWKALPLLASPSTLHLPSSMNLPRNPRPFLHLCTSHHVLQLLPALCNPILPFSIHITHYRQHGVRRNGRTVHPQPRRTRACAVQNLRVADHGKNASFLMPEVNDKSGKERTSERDQVYQYHYQSVTGIVIPLADRQNEDIPVHVTVRSDPYVKSYIEWMFKFNFKDSDVNRQPSHKARIFATFRKAREPSDPKDNSSYVNRLKATHLKYCKLSRSSRICFPRYRAT